MTDKKKPISRAEIDEIMKIIQEAYKKAGKKVQMASLIGGVGEDGSMEAEILVDNIDKKDKH